MKKGLVFLLAITFACTGIHAWSPTVYRLILEVARIHSPEGVQWLQSQLQRQTLEEIVTLSMQEPEGLSVNAYFELYPHDPQNMLTPYEANNVRGHGQLQSTLNGIMAHRSWPDALRIGDFLHLMAYAHHPLHCIHHVDRAHMDGDRHGELMILQDDANLRDFVSGCDPVLNEGQSWEALALQIDATRSNIDPDDVVYNWTVGSFQTAVTIYDALLNSSPDGLRRQVSALIRRQIALAGRNLACVLDRARNSGEVRRGGPNVAQLVVAAAALVADANSNT